MERFAAIDVGSNSLKLTVAARTDAQGFEVIATEYRVPQLGRDAGADGALDADAMSRTIEALSSVLESVAHLEIERIRVVATQAVRGAPNRTDFIRLVHSACGIEMEVLDPSEEAGLSWSAICGEQDVGDEPSVLIDVGGGSAECLLAIGEDVQDVVSLPLGALRLTDQFDLRDRFDVDAWSAAVEHAGAVIEDMLPRPDTTPYAWAVGGTCTALVELDRRGIGLGGNSDVVPASGAWAFTGLALDRIDAIIETVRHMPLTERERASGLDAARAAIMPAGGLVVQALLRRLGVTTGCCVTHHGVRDGVLRSMLEDV